MHNKNQTNYYYQLICSCTTKERDQLCWRLFYYKTHSQSWARQQVGGGRIGMLSGDFSTCTLWFDLVHAMHSPLVSIVACMHSGCNSMFMSPEKEDSLATKFHNIWAVAGFTTNLQVSTWLEVELNLKGCCNSCGKIFGMWQPGTVRQWRNCLFQACTYYIPIYSSGRPCQIISSLPKAVILNTVPYLFITCACCKLLLK